MNYISFEEFLARSKGAPYPDNVAHVEHMGVRMYVRRVDRTFDIGAPRVGVLDLASISVIGERGKGTFTAALEDIEATAEAEGLEIYVENVQTERFQEFWVKRGYERLTKLNRPTCFLGPSK